LKPVLVVKVDNAAAARPQAGLGNADIVYEELVEGGQTRFMAVFSTKAAPTLGPIRSARESDLQILAAYGKVLFAFSGANGGVRATVRRSNVIDGSADVAGGAYYRQSGRRAPYNLFSSTGALLKAKPGAAKAKDIGLRFGPLTLPAKPVKQLRLTWSPFTTTSFVWDPPSRSWGRSQNGRVSMLASGKRMAARNVIVQYVTIRASRYRDVTGAVTPFTATVGKGNVDIFRDGKKIAGKWSRPKAGAPTRYFDPATNKAITLAPGPVWILLAPSNTRAAVS